MGDHRANIKIEMEFHGIKDSCDMWINYFPGEYDGVDDRIIEFIQDIYKKGMAKYDKEIAKYWAEQNKAEIEKEERKVLKRLKKKYGR